jgi:hypothetical protein
MGKISNVIERSHVIKLEKYLFHVQFKYPPAFHEQYLGVIDCTE